MEKIQRIAKKASNWNLKEPSRPNSKFSELKIKRKRSNVKINENWTRQIIKYKNKLKFCKNSITKIT